MQIQQYADRTDEPDFQEQSMKKQNDVETIKSEKFIDEEKQLQERNKVKKIDLKKTETCVACYKGSKLCGKKNRERVLVSGQSTRSHDGSLQAVGLH